MTRPICILIGALGGQGGGVLAEWLVDAATQAGHVAQSTSIPGVAQRTGATTYYVEVYPIRRDALQGRTPVLGLYPVPGGVDVVIASELLEAGRIVAAGYVSADRTLTIASTSRTLTTSEKMALGDGRFDSDRLLDVARAHSRRLCTLDMDAIAREAGTVVSAVMLGALSATGILPIATDVFERVVRASGVGVEASLRGFARGYAAVAEATGQHRGQTPSIAWGLTPILAASAATPAPPVSPSAHAAAAVFPAPARDLVVVGYDRVVEFQDERYGELYLARLRAIDAAERSADPDGARRGHVLRETARFLALWMAFDDIVRVAALKCRAARFARVRREIGAGDADVVHIVDHFKPGVPEFAGLLPRSLARRLIAWDRARQAHGRAPVAWALHLRTHSVAGFALLRVLAGLRRVRRGGARYVDEQARIERWLHAVLAGCAVDWRIGQEIALCGRLIKGYGETNERGKATLAHILEHVAGGARACAPHERAEAIRAAREAALADEGGRALDAELARRGAPPRPVIAQPIVWAPRRPPPAARAHG